MHKCTNCGTEFDSKFCPECGQKWIDQDACPQCGNTLPSNVKFCPDCGYRIAPQTEGDKTDRTKRKIKSTDDTAFAAWVHGLLRYVSVALTLLFAVLLPLLYIAPIAEAGEMLSGAENINVYSLDEDFFGVSVAYLVFMCIALLLAAITLHLLINKNRRNKYITIFGKVRISAGELFALLAVILVYIPCLIISAVAMGDAAELNELLGGGVADMVFAGAAPKAVLSFAVIFTVFAIGVAIASALIAKSNPELLPKDEGSQAEVTPCRKPLLCYAFLNAKLRHAAFAFFMCTVFTLIMLSFFTGILSDATTFKPYIIVTIGCGITAVAVVVCMLLPNDRSWSPDKFIFEVRRKRKHGRDGLAMQHDRCKLGIKKSILLFVVFVTFIGDFIQNVVQGTAVYKRSLIMVAVYVGMSAIIYVIAKVAIAMQSGYIAQYLFGTVSPLPNASLAVEFNQERELAAYDTYVLAKKHGAVVSESGIEKQRVFTRRLALVVACILFVAITVACAVVSPFLTNKFSASFVSGTAKAMQAEQYVNLETLFGKPNEFEEYGEESVLVVYYDDEYADLKAKLEKAQKESNIAKVQELNSKIAALTFNSLTIHIEKSSQDYKDHLSWAIIEKIALNTKTTGGKTASQKKTTKSVTVFYVEYDRHDRHSGYYAEIFYTDGSYKFTPLPETALSGIDPDKSGVQTVTWSDEWGSYSATVKSE